MKRHRHTPEQIVRKLREGDRLLNHGRDLAEVLWDLEVPELSWNRWRNQYGGMKANEAKRLRELESENARLSGGPPTNQRSHDSWNTPRGPATTIAAELNSPSLRSRARCSWTGIARRGLRTPGPIATRPLTATIRTTRSIHRRAAHDGCVVRMGMVRDAHLR
jgi:hypothetical protein